MLIDDFNRKILNHLEENARASFAEIGKKIGLSAQAVGQRVKQMEAEGIIEGYSLKLNHTKLGIDIKALVRVRVQLGQMLRFKKKLQEFEEIKASYRITGEDCIILLVHFLDNQHLISFLDELSEFGHTKTNIILGDV